jgi:L-lactate permease
MFLNGADALTWDWPWWNRGAPWLIFLIGYLHFFLVAFWVYDMRSMKNKLRTLGVIYGFDAICLVVFAAILGWI